MYHFKYVMVGHSSCFITNNHRIPFTTCFQKVTREATKILPIISVVAISLILAAVVGGSKSQILKTGFLIFIVVILHNVVGYLLGYVLAHVFKLDRRDKKAVSIEVGMQNSV